MAFMEIQREYTDPNHCPLPFVLFTCGRSSSQRATERPQGFPYHHVLWVEKGRGVCSVGEEAFALSEGEGFLCRRNIPHAYRQDGDSFETVWITFSCMEGILEYYSLPGWFRFPVTPLLRSFCEELEALSSRNSTILSRSADGYSWLAEWLAQLFAPYASTSALVRQFLENHFSESLTLDEVAGHVHMDKFALCHAIRKERGVTVMELLKRIRIAKAKQFLRYTPYPVETIGKLCGYESASYFGKLFREQTGRSPREYRASGAAGENAAGASGIQ